MKSKHTGIWIIHINLEQEKREYIDSWTDFLLENKISELCIKNNVTIMFV